MDETWMIESNCENVRIWSEFFETEKENDFLWIAKKSYHGNATIDRTINSNSTIRFKSNEETNKKGFKLVWSCEDGLWGLPAGLTCENNASGYLPSNYNGNISVTVEGILCQPWEGNTPDFLTYINLNDVQAAKNFCRDPNGNLDGAWCYTTDPDKRWDYCNCDMGLMPGW